MSGWPAIPLSRLGFGGGAYDFNQPAWSWPVHIIPYYDFISILSYYYEYHKPQYPLPKRRKRHTGGDETKGFPSISMGRAVARATRRQDRPRGLPSTGPSCTVRHWTVAL